MEDWIDASERPPRDGETITLPGLKGRYEVRGAALYEKGRLVFPVSLVDKYRIEEDL